jgi:hypothetical protein
MTVSPQTTSIGDEESPIDRRTENLDLEEKGTSTIGDRERESPPNGPLPLEKWNSSTTNICRVVAANYSFIILGMNDAAYGVSVNDGVSNVRLANKIPRP